MNCTVSIVAEIPEDLLSSLRDYLDSHPAWDHDRTMTAALSLFLMQNPVTQPKSLSSAQSATQTHRQNSDQRGGDEQTEYGQRNHPCRRPAQIYLSTLFPQSA